MPTPTRSALPRTIVIGAGPAGLTAALRFAQSGRPPVILEADDVVGGISRTVVRDEWRFDIGGHRFFTKVPEVEMLWDDLLPDGRFMTRPRLSRIYYDGKFFDYPLSPANALANLGPVETARCVLSYLRARLRRNVDDGSFESWVSSRFGDRLYRMFFKTYTEKVWGVPADRLAADWAAQRIKSLSLGAAIRDAVGWHNRGEPVTSLIEEFRYPTLGPGMMWEECRDRALELGAELHLRSPVTSVAHRGGRAVEVVAAHRLSVPADQVISSMPLGALVASMRPAAPPAVLHAARALRHRDFLTVALVVPESAAFPDNWIYIHSPEVRIGRVQNFGAWSPYMVQPGTTCLGCEYFVNEGDELWTMPDDDLVGFATKELESIGLLDAAVVDHGYVTRVPKAYPVYDHHYHGHLETLRAWLDEHATNVHPVGRNGMHRYNNQDHSMLTAMLAVDNIVNGAEHDLWAVNVDDEYHEERVAGDDGGGRAAPLIA
jgi:protoporphyrinogen oxidase